MREHGRDLFAILRYIRNELCNDEQAVCTNGTAKTKEHEHGEGRRHGDRSSTSDKVCNNDDNGRTKDPEERGRRREEGAPHEKK
jgi:hypothetical protein